MIGRTTVKRPSLRELRAETDEGVLRLAMLVWPELAYVSDERRREPYRTRDLERSKYALPHQGDQERERRMLALAVAYKGIDWVELNRIYERRLDRVRPTWREEMRAA